MRGQRATLLLLLVVTVVASLVTADRSLRRRARHRLAPPVQVMQVLLSSPLLTSSHDNKIFLTISHLPDRVTEPVQRCVQLQGGETEIKNEEPA